jgi:eukaryotic-like serine/threonine-protein kinase
MGTVFRFGPYESHARSRELYKHGVKLKIRPQPLQVLNLLLSRAGDVVTREEFRRQLWSTGTFVDFEHSLNTSVRELRAILDESAAEPRYIETLPKLGYRFIAPVASEEKLPEVASGRVHEPSDHVALRSEFQSEARSEKRASHPWLRWAGVVAVILLVVAAMGFGYRRNHRVVANEKSGLLPSVPPVEKDIIVLTDFANKTGDPVFDETLKQALTMELTQSPNLNVSSSLQVQEVLRRMNRSPGEPVTREVGAEICSRLAGKAVVAGAVAKLATNYVIELEALGCENGSTLGLAQAEARNKDDVIKALDQATSQIRTKLGESLPSLRKYSFPVDATTSSLPALKAFSMGLKAEREKHPVEGIPFYKEAIHLDPNFGLAYAVLGRAYEDMGEDKQATENYIQAYKLRDHLSERERYFVTTLYEETVTGDLQKAREAGEVWVEVYPRDVFAREKLATVYFDLGEIEKASEQAEEALRLDPTSEVNIFNAAAALLATGRAKESSELLHTAQSQGQNGPAVIAALYLEAFQNRDMLEMERQIARAAGEPVMESILLAVHSETQAFFGRMQKATDLTDRAIKSARKIGDKETAANCSIVSALRKIEIGNGSQSEPDVRSALALAPTRNVKVQAALAWARSGKIEPARTLLNELKRNYPTNTLVQSYWGPAIQASIELHRGNGGAALADLEISAPYDLSQAPPLGDDIFMYPTYLRGEAYLTLKDGADAATQFSKVLAHPGTAINCILYPLSRLQLARAMIITGDQAAARREYEQFLSDWKGADPEIPVLKQAKSEYESLR